MCMCISVAESPADIDFRAAVSSGHGVGSVAA